MIYFKYYFLCFIFLVVSTKSNATENQLAEYAQYVQEITRSFAKEMEAEYGLKCIEKGGGMPYDVELIDLAFITYKKGNIEEVRELEIRATEKLLQIINTHEKIRPFLREYPFKANRAEVSIAFRKPDNSCYSDGSVVHVFQVKNKIYYRAEDPKSHNRYSLAEEFYDDAKAKITAKSKNL